MPILFIRLKISKANIMIAYIVPRPSFWMY